METLKRPACTVGWVVRLPLLAFPGERNLNFPWEESHWDNTVVKANSLPLTRSEGATMWGILQLVNVEGLIREKNTANQMTSQSWLDPVSYTHLTLPTTRMV